MKITIHELSELIGTTPEAIRKYEKKGIIKPIRSTNGYREFELMDVGKLVCVRQYRNCGFSLDEITRLFSNQTHLEIEEMIQKKESELKAQIEELENMKKTLSELNQDLMKLEKEYRYETRPALYFDPYLDIDGINPNKKQIKIAQEIINTTHGSFTGNVLNAKNPDIGFNTGVFHTDDMEFESNKLSKYYKKQKCLCVTVYVGISIPFSEQFKKAKKVIRQDGYQMDGDIIAKFVCPIFSEEINKEIYEYLCYIPVKKMK